MQTGCTVFSNDVYIDRTKTRSMCLVTSLEVQSNLIYSSWIYQHKAWCIGIKTIDLLPFLHVGSLDTKDKAIDWPYADWQTINLYKSDVFWVDFNFLYQNIAYICNFLNHSLRVSWYVYHWPLLICHTYFRIYGIYMKLMTIHTIPAMSSQHEVIWHVV